MAYQNMNLAAHQMAQIHRQANEQSSAYCLITHDKLDSCEISMRVVEIYY